MAERTIRSLLGAGVDGAPALRAPGLPPLSYAATRRHAAGFAGALRASGIVSGDTVAIVLPNGPEMAQAFLATALACAAAPLNPAYREAEFDFYLGDLGARALIVDADERGPAIAAAKARGVPLIRIGREAGDPAGLFRGGDLPEANGQASDPAPEDVALVLHTSGTTSRPKIVPLTHGNLAASAANIAATLRLAPDDVCLNIMPLFHIHGLIAAVLASLGAGGSIVCTPGFNALKFMGWLKSERPTWYTAVPAMHQAIVERAGRQSEEASGAGLRFVRSSSASLPAPVCAAIEAAFGCPAIEAYGMTEASHQMTSNPLPPGVRKVGSVGVGQGVAVRVVDEAGRERARGMEGEIAIGGGNVTPGYRADDRANAESFFSDAGGRWFRTGDLGVMDADGYLRVTGRIKEIINRGGEKVAPREVDDVLMEHPAVAQAIAFAVPHDKLGEEVAAAIVLRPEVVATAEELRRHAAAKLAAFKVPRTILIVPEIPKGPTGKPQRIGLARKLGLAP